jgi:hypothetical protein
LAYRVIGIKLMRRFNADLPQSKLDTVRGQGDAFEMALDKVPITVRQLLSPCARLFAVALSRKSQSEINPSYWPIRESRSPASP